MAQTHAPTSSGAPSARRDDARILQHDGAAEASILGGVILQPEALGVLEDLEVDDFYDNRHKVVFAAIRNLEARGAPIDVVTLEDEIRRGGKLEAIGGPGFLGELALAVPTVENVEHYKRIVRMHASNRQVQLVLGSALHRVQSWPHDPFELVSEVAGELARIDEDRRAAQPVAERRARWTIPLEQFLGDEEPDDDDAQDWLIRDLIPRAEPTLWAGPMKAGKTWGALDLMIAVALGESWLGRFDNTLGRPGRVLGVFLEDNKRRLAKRLWELSRARYKTPNDPVLREHLRLSRAPLRLPDAQDQRRLVRELKTWGADLVFVDNLTRVMVGDPNSTREASAFTRAWLEVGEEAGCTILFLHHTKKPSGDQRDVDPFNEIRGSSDFGAAARNIIVSSPIPHETQKLSAVRMRGNLDLRVESFVLGFEREMGPLGRYVAKLTDRGEVSVVKDEVKQQRISEKETARARAAEETYQKRKNLALELAHKDGGFVTAKRLANMCGLSSDRAVAGVFDRMVTDRLLERAGKLGFAIPGTTRQGVL